MIKLNLLTIFPFAGTLFVLGGLPLLAENVKCPDIHKIHTPLIYVWQRPTLKNIQSISWQGRGPQPQAFHEVLIRGHIWCTYDYGATSLRLLSYPFGGCVENKRGDGLECT